MLDSLKDTYSIFWVDLQNLRHHWRSTVLISLVQPLLYIIAFGYGLGNAVNIEGESYLAFVIPGIVALTAFSSSYNGSSSKLQMDKLFYKSFDNFLMSPVSFYSIVWGKALIGVVRGLISSVAILLVGLVLLPTLTVSPIFILTLLISCFVFALFGVLIALVFNEHEKIWNFSNLVILPMTFLCGTFFSLNQVPEALKIALYLLPLTHSSLCLRAAALNQSFPWLSFLVLIGYGIFFFSASIVTLKKGSV